MNAATEALAKSAEYWLKEAIKSDKIAIDIIAYFLSRDVRRQGHRQSDLNIVASEMIGMAKTNDDDWKSVIDEIIEVS